MAYFDYPSASKPVASGGSSTSLYSGGGKRLLDLVLAVAMLPIALPLIGVIWLAVRRPGAPGFFGHVRVGRDGRPFVCWKIRTMVPDADEALPRLLAQDPSAAADWAKCQKLTVDPRVTLLGVRRQSFWNQWLPNLRECLSHLPLLSG
jgi:exopolysaccharide production protein ExoY